LAAPADNGKSLPARDLVALGHHARRAIDRPAKSDANAFDRVLLQKPSDRGFDLLNNAGRAAADIDIVPHEGRQLPATGVTPAQLELRTADFDAQEHCVIARENPSVPRI